MDEIICEWYALCANPTTLAADHPIMGPVPCCNRCANKHDLERPYKLELVK